MRLDELILEKVARVCKGKCAGLASGKESWAGKLTVGELVRGEER